MGSGLKNAEGKDWRRGSKNAPKGAKEKTLGSPGISSSRIQKVPNRRNRGDNKFAPVPD